MTEARQIRRDSPGAIYFDFYRRQAVALRASTMRDALKLEVAFRVAGKMAATGLAIAAALRRHRLGYGR